MKNGFTPQMVLLNGHYDGEYSGGVSGGDTNPTDSYLDQDGNLWIYVDEEFSSLSGFGVGWWRDDFSEYHGPNPDPSWTPVL